MCIEAKEEEKRDFPLGHAVADLEKVPFQSLIWYHRGKQGEVLLF